MLIGFSDASYTFVESLRKSTVRGLVPQDGSILDPTKPPEDPYTVTHCVLASDDPFARHGIVIAAFTTSEERRQYIRNFSAQWLS